MNKVPNSIKEHVSNARYYLEAVDKFPTPTRNAIYILMLLIGWENIVIAREELSAWARKKQIDKKLYKDHSIKLDKIHPKIIHNVWDQSGTKLIEEEFSGGKKLDELREMCQYGLKSGNKSVDELFRSHWHTDNFRNGFIQKIEWVEMLIDVYEKQLN